jgi:hypothetical protein
VGAFVVRASLMSALWLTVGVVIFGMSVREPWVLATAVTFGPVMTLLRSRQTRA